LIEQVNDLFFFLFNVTLIYIIGGFQRDPDNDWKPHKKARHSDHDDDEDNSTDESELNLLKDEANEFIQGSSINDQRPAKKKARVHISDEDD
jgi:hypothetical protein